ncbi:MAG: TRAP transporter substrate-binding protein DctP [Betaproteobacteria bacterium]|nr:TRAP transporter substrate-binding protein DctP [Betaproteobacteria bacterium]
MTSCSRPHSGLVSRTLLASRFVALVAGLVIATAAEAQVVVKLGTIAPEGSVWGDALQRVARSWKEASGGKVELRIFAGGVLGGEDELVRKLQRRVIDAVTLSGSGLPTLERSFNCLNMPLLFESSDELDYVRERVAPAIEKRLDAKGFAVLNWAIAGWVNIFSKEPIRLPADLRRTRFWMSSGDPETEKIYKAFGVHVVPLPVTEMMTGLQTGLIDATAAPPLYALLDRTFQVAGHMLDIHWGALNAATIVRADAWARVPEELRPRLAEAARREGVAMRDVGRKSGDDAVREMQKRGLVVTVPTAAERAKWREEAASTYPGLRGAYCPAELYDDVMRFHAESRRPR